MLRIQLKMKKSCFKLEKKSQIEARNMLTSRWGGLTLQEALSTKGLTEYLRERWCQLTGSGHQLQSTERAEREERTVLGYNIWFNVKINK